MSDDRNDCRLEHEYRSVLLIVKENSDKKKLSAPFALHTHTHFWSEEKTNFNFFDSRDLSGSKLFAKHLCKYFVVRVWFGDETTKSGMNKSEKAYKSSNFPITISTLKVSLIVNTILKVSQYLLFWIGSWNECNIWGTSSWTEESVLVSR